MIMTSPEQTFSRGQLAKHTAVKSETIRYYERCGLLHAPARSAGGHRIYTQDDASRLIFIRRCRELGFTLDEIGSLVELAGDENMNCSQVRELTAEHLLDVQGKIKDLRKMERMLKSMVKQCDENASPNCPIIETLSN